MDASLIARRSHDEYWRPTTTGAGSGIFPGGRSRPQSGVAGTPGPRSGRQAAYLALWQQRQNRVQSSRPLGTPRCYLTVSRPPSSVQPRQPPTTTSPVRPPSSVQPRQAPAAPSRPPSSVQPTSRPSSGAQQRPVSTTTPRPAAVTNLPRPQPPAAITSRPAAVLASRPTTATNTSRPTAVLAPRPPPGIVPRPPTNGPRPRVARRVLSSHFGGAPITREVLADVERVQLTVPPNFTKQEILVAPPVSWRRDESTLSLCQERDAQAAMENGRSVRFQEPEDSNDAVINHNHVNNSDEDDDDTDGDCDDTDSSEQQAPIPKPRVVRPPTPPPRRMKLSPAPEVLTTRPILKRAKMREARLVPQSTYLPSPQSGPMLQDAELTDILTIRPKPMTTPRATPRDSSRDPAVKTGGAIRGVRFNMANTEVIEIGRRPPPPPTKRPLLPSPFRLS